MTDILQACSKLFAGNIHETVAEPFNLDQAKRIFPNLEASDEAPIRLLVNGLIDLLPELEKVISDRDNLPIDRTLTSMIYTYLIMPFDLIPDDENGLIGYLDDALIANLLAQQLEEPDARLRDILETSAAATAAMMTKLPEWFTQAVNRYSELAHSQVQVIHSH